MLSKRHQKPPKKFGKDFSVAPNKLALVSLVPKRRPKNASKKDDDFRLLLLLLLLLLVVVVVVVVVHQHKASLIVSNWKTIRERSLRSAGRRRSLRSQEKTNTTALPPPQSAKDDDDAPRRPSWRPVRRTRLAGRTRARRRPDYTLACIV